MASFYFWNSGTLVQRSQAGLLRSILYEILQQHRDLIPVILPGPWARAYSLLPWQGTKRGYAGDITFRGLESPRSWSESWSTPVLVQTFELLVRQQAIPLKLCFFIDGLDEYDGDHFQISELFRKITSTSVNVKACLSSRPLLVFEDAFKASSNLRLQELTFEDIRRYINDKLSNNERFRNLAEREPLRAPSLVDDVVTKADGVFLWVKLVVKSLLEGLSNRDTFSDLQHRLRLLPADLEDLYTLMMKRIDSFYLSKASEAFQLLVAAHEVADTIGPTDNSASGALTILTLCLADAEKGELAAYERAGSLKEDQYSLKCDEMTDRLKIRCAGLIEVQGREYGRPSWPRIPKSGAKVQYLHRTVRDYFLRPEVWSSVLSWASDPDFDPHSALLKSFVLQLRVIPESQSELTRLEIASSALGHAYYAERSTRLSNVPLLDQLDCIMTDHYIRTSNFQNTHWTVEMDHVDYALHASFLLYAVRYGLVMYVEEKLKGRKGSRFRKLCNILLRYACEPTTPFFKYPISPEVVSLLLKHGANPDTKPKGFPRTPWETALENAAKFASIDTKTPAILNRRLSLLKNLLQYGANPSVIVQVSLNSHTVASLLQTEFALILPSEAAEFEGLLSSWKFAGPSRIGLKLWRHIS